MALIGCLSNVGNTAVAISGNSSGGGNTTNSPTMPPRGIWVMNDPAATNTVFYGFANTVTAGNSTLSNTAFDNTNGYPLKAGQERFISAAEFQNAGGVNCSTANLYIITFIAPQRVYFQVM